MMSMGWSLRRGRGLLVLAVVALVGMAVAGCTSFFNHNLVNSDETPAKLISDAALVTTKPLTTRPLSAGGDSCVSPVMEPDRSQILQEALGDSQLQAVRAKLESRGLPIDLAGAMALHVADGEEVLIPFGQQAYLIWSHHQTQTTAVGTIQQGGKTLNITADGADWWVRALTSKQAQKLLKQLRQKDKFKEFEKQLKQQGKKLADGRTHVLLDETRGTVAIGLTTDDSPEGHYTHQTRVRVKTGKDDELDDNADPLVQETACASAGQASTTSRTQVVPQLIDCTSGCESGDPPISFPDPSYGTICTSSWGYDYRCTSSTPALAVTTSVVQLATFIGGFQPENTFVMWNAGGGTLQGTVTATAPFSIVSGGSFSLGPGQPNEVVVRFSPTAANKFVNGITIRNDLWQVIGTVSAHGVALTAQDFFNILSDLSRQTDLSTLIPTQRVNLELDGFRNITASDIGTLVQVAETGNWSSSGEIYSDQYQWVGWIVRTILSYVIRQALDYFLHPNAGFSTIEVINSLQQLGTTTSFDTLYDNLKREKVTFGAFVNALEQALQQAFNTTNDSTVFALFGGATNAAGAAKSIIHDFSGIYVSGKYNQGDLTTLVSEFGPVTALSMVGLDKLDSSGVTGNNVIHYMMNILNDQHGSNQLQHNDQGSLWKSLMRAFTILGMYGIKPNDSALSKEFQETLAALAVTNAMALSHQWNIFGVRLSVPAEDPNNPTHKAITIDVFGTTHITDKNSKSYLLTVFSQVFHAVTGYDPTQLGAFLDWVSKLANATPFDRQWMLSFMQNPSDMVFVSTWTDQFVVVVAVKSSDSSKAVNAISQRQQNCTANCFFGVVVSIDDNGYVVAITPVGAGITQDEATQIARRMGFRVGYLAPWMQAPPCGAQNAGLKVIPARIC